MALISNTGPLLSFARARRLPLLREVVDTLLIPDAVYDEIVTQGTGRAGASEVQHAGWITRVAVSDLEFVTALPPALHAGEREAIALARECDGVVLIGEQTARRAAEQHGIAYIGSLRVLEEAKRRGLIPVVKPVLDELIAAGMYLSESLYRSFLRRMMESDEE